VAAAGSAGPDRAAWYTDRTTRPAWEGAGRGADVARHGRSRTVVGNALSHKGGRHDWRGAGRLSDNEGMQTTPDVRVARVYDHPEADGGARVLVDRLWPRGLSKESARLDEWVKDVAPSTGLRHWYGHEPARFAEFAARYRAELSGPGQATALDHLAEMCDRGPVTLLTATGAVDLSHAAVLVSVLTDTAA
jgi:uncharacterized protein YeaO (DUF488 family)